MALPALPGPPRLLVKEQQRASILQKAQRYDWAQKVFEGQVKGRAEHLLKAPVEIPDKGGQWYHWYACKRCGARLKTVSPTKHVCPNCGAVYTGWPWDDVVIMRKHDDNARTARTLALAGFLLQRREFCRKAAEYLLGYARKYESYPLHDVHGKPRTGGGKVGPQTLDEAVWLISMLQAADCCWPHLLDEERSVLKEHLFRPAARILQSTKLGIHNIQCWLNAGLGLAGLLLEDEALVKEALEPPWAWPPS